MAFLASPTAQNVCVRIATKKKQQKAVKTKIEALNLIFTTH